MTSTALKASSDNAEMTKTTDTRIKIPRPIIALFTSLQKKRINGDKLGRQRGRNPKEETETRAQRDFSSQIKSERVDLDS